MKKNNKRKHFRYIPDKNCLVELYGKKSNHHRTKIVGLCRDESYDGCSAIFRTPFPFKKGDKISSNVGNIAYQKSEIKWVVKFDEVLVKVGIHFIEM